jgi:two-component system CheB/CheR fusion protein
MKARTLQEQLAEAEATIRALQDELADTNRGLVALSMELEQRVEARTAELAQSNQALRQSEERFRLAIQATNDAIWDINLATGTVHWNETYATAFGRPPETKDSWQWWIDRIYPEDRERTVGTFRAAIDGRETTWTCEYRFLRADGSWADIYDRAFIARDESAKAWRVVGAMLDITDRKRAEEDLRAAKDSAEQAKAAADQANRAKDHFLAVLSHELRTPLTPVVMGVSMLQGRPDLDPKVREMLEMVRRNVEMEAQLIDDLLDVTRIARGKIVLTRSPVELCSVIQRAVEVCKPDIVARKLHFGIDLGPAAPYWVEADVPRLQQVFWNLLKNAIKFTPHGGCVGIRCRPEEGHVLAEVNDSGIGIEAEALGRIFNAFEQAERSITRQFGGLGLGLAISKALVELHGGTIEVRSEGRDKGATFRIRLPLCAPAGQPAASSPAAPPQRAVRPLRILLVEDHGVTAKMLRMVLSAEGHTIQTAGDVATALGLADQHTFDLLVSDLGLPDGSGHDLMRRLRERGHKFPGIALSGYGQEEDIKRSYQSGFAAHLTKPASREAVVQVIASVTARESE